MIGFEDALSILLADEKGYVDHKNDRGGKTNFGITEATARDYGYFGDMRDLTRSDARKIYLSMGFWTEELSRLPFGVAFSIFEARVMHGAHRANKMVQHVCGAKKDGVFGPNTEAAVSRLDPVLFCLLFNCYRLEFIAEIDNFNSFGSGWVSRISRTMSRSARSCFH